ncbi:MAG: hypothetical protein HeimC3_54520 [Candidatus Heimdallarchaeota archaeon LC_3]|nr:MAG: hypothetical protein HeimC3_54520 [Candidatus Heimdallarchaeota archaeon LC_3]
MDEQVLSSFLIPLAFISTIVYGIVALYIKYLLYHMKNPMNLLLIQMIINFIFILAIYLVMSVLGIYPVEVITLGNIILIIISTIFLFFGILSLYYGFKVGNVSVGGLILSSRVFVSVLLAIIFLNEIYSLNIYFWFFFIFLGIIFISWQEDFSFIKGVRNSGSIYFLLTIFLWGFANVIIGAVNNEVFVISFLIIRLLVLNTLTILLYPKLKEYLGEDHPLHFELKSIFLISVFVLIATIGDAAYIMALGESVTITEAIGAFQGVIVFILVLLLSQNSLLRSIYNEPLKKKTLLVRFLGITIATIATLIMIYELGSLNI